MTEPATPTMKWVEELPKRGAYKNTSPEWEAIAAELRTRPGDWAFLGRRNAQVVGSVKTARLTAFKPAGAFEATGRESATSEDSKSVTANIYVRYVGAEEEKEEVTE